MTTVMLKMLLVQIAKKKLGWQLKPSQKLQCDHAIVPAVPISGLKVKLQQYQ
jgi:hypothetical protein